MPMKYPRVALGAPGLAFGEQSIRKVHTNLGAKTWLGKLMRFSHSDVTYKSNRYENVIHARILAPAYGRATSRLLHGY